jgi:hypothetical protein
MDNRELYNQSLKLLQKDADKNGVKNKIIPSIKVAIGDVFVADSGKLFRVKNVYKPDEEAYIYFDLENLGVVKYSIKDDVLIQDC